MATSKQHYTEAEEIIGLYHSRSQRRRDLEAKKYTGPDAEPVKLSYDEECELEDLWSLGELLTLAQVHATLATTGFSKWEFQD